MFDEFYIDGPNGRHLCLVSEPASCSIAASKVASTNGMFPMRLARAVAAQTILGLEYIHTCDIAHGDLHLKNILFRLPHIDSLSIDEIYQRFGRPEKTEIGRTDWAALGPEVPPYSVMPAQLVIASDEIGDPRLVISDFGEAWRTDTDSRHRLHTPLLFLPPETTFSKTSIGSSADVWTLGCTLYEVLGERPLFEEGLMSNKHDVIAEMINCLGLLPQQWWMAWQMRPAFFLEDGSCRTDMNHFHDLRSRPLLLRIQQMGRETDAPFLQGESMALEKMLRPMLEYEPSKRATIADVVKSDWFNQFALPSLHESTQAVNRVLAKG